MIPDDKALRAARDGLHNISDTLLLAIRPRLLADRTRLIDEALDELQAVANLFGCKMVEANDRPLTVTTDDRRGDGGEEWVGR